MTTTSIDLSTRPRARSGRAQPAPVRSGLLRGGWTRSLGLAVAVALLLVMVVGSLLIGTYSVGYTDIVGALTGIPENDVQRVVRHVRLPRTLAGLLAGGALGVAGVVMQGLTRNPLAGPGLLGINSGAALAVVVSMALFGISTASGHMWFALVGAAVAALFVYTLGSLGFGGATPVKLALAGAALTALLGAITSMVTLQSASTMDEFRFWVVGSLTRADMTTLTVVAPFLGVGVLLAAGVMRSLNTIALGDDLARSLGNRLWVDRSVAALAVVLLAGGSTAIAGPLAFIGLVIPHVARLITGPDHRWVMAWTLVLAPGLLLFADTLGRVLVRPEQLQVGIITALAGAPFFLWLVRNRKVVGV